MNKIQYIELLKLRGITNLKDRSIGLSIAEAVKNSGGNPTTEEMVIVNEQAMKYFLENNIELSEDIEKLTKENSEYVDRIVFLDALEAAGVDNWEGYSFAQEIMKEWQQEND